MTISEAKAGRELPTRAMLARGHSLEHRTQAAGIWVLRSWESKRQ